ncbi:MAG TPA: hypothetical protein PKI67_14775, partial [bacterium]|nr:hypothetical protein [bacterium]
KINFNFKLNENNELKIESDWWKLLIGLYEPMMIDQNLVISTLNDLDKNQPLFFVLLTIVCLNHTKDWAGIEPFTTTYPNLFIDENTTYCTVPVR